MNTMKHMNTKSVTAIVVVLVMFGVLNLIHFSEGVRTVQVVGLLGSGMCIAAAIFIITASIRAKTKTE